MYWYFFNESSKFLKLHIELILRDICHVKLLGSHTKIREEKLLLERTCFKCKMYDFRDFVDIALIDQMGNYLRYLIKEVFRISLIGEQEINREHLVNRNRNIVL